MPSARSARVMACELLAAGPELLAVGPELLAAGPELLAVGPELLAAGPELLAVGPELLVFRCADPDSFSSCRTLTFGLLPPALQPLSAPHLRASSPINKTEATD